MTAAVWLNQNLGELVFLFWVGGTDIAGTGRQVIAAWEPADAIALLAGRGDIGELSRRGNP